jgi:hypothetical protein
MYPDPSNLSVAVLTPQAQQFMGEAVLAQCDLLDGIEDGILNNPLACNIDVDDFACADGQTDACLTPAQVEAARRDPEPRSARPAGHSGLQEGLRRLPAASFRKAFL